MYVYIIYTYTYIYAIYTYTVVLRVFLGIPVHLPEAGL